MTNNQVTPSSDSNEDGPVHVWSKEMQDHCKKLYGGIHPRFDPKHYDLNQQTFIFPGTENGQRIRLNCGLKNPPEHGADDFMNWLIKGPADENIKTVYDIWENSKKKYADRPCLGDRRHGGFDFQWKSYQQVGELVNKIGSALVSQLGVKQVNDYNVGVYSGNCWEWTAANLSSHSYGFTMVPMFDTLGDDHRRYIVNECEFEVMLIDIEPRIKQFIKTVHNHKEGRKVKHIVSFNKCSKEVVMMAKKADVNLIFMDNLLSGQKTVLPHKPPKPEDIFALLYTSGTGGNPKGIVASHGGFVSLMGAGECCWGKFEPTETWLSFLPCAHVIERCMQTFVLMRGAKIGYFCGDPQRLISDAGCLKPTRFAAVPRIWNKIYCGLETMKHSSWVKNKLITWALDAKYKEIFAGKFRTNSFWDLLVFKKLQTKLGGKVMAGCCGAAPVKLEVINTMRAAFGMNLYNSYGQTETLGGCVVGHPFDVTSSVGLPVACCAVRLDSIPGLDYLCENDQGEICVKGWSNMLGYYKNEEKTKEVFTEDGWLRTGDVGQWNKDGSLQIIDRVKNIFKTSVGVYISPERIENVYLLHQAVGQIFIYGDSFRDGIVAIIVPNQDNFIKWATGVSSEDSTMTIDDLLEDNRIKLTKRLLTELIQHGKKSGLKAFEQIKSLHLTNEMFTTENNLMTPTMKVKRIQAENHFRPIIDEMYTHIVATDE